MTDRYEPPKGTKIMGVLAAIFLAVGIGSLALLFIVPEIIGLPLTFIILGIVFLLFYFDLKNPNGKFTLVETHPYSYNIIRRNKEKNSPENTYGQNISKEQMNTNENPTYVHKSRKKKKNTTGVYTYINCPHCGSLNESGNDRCRSCEKKL